MFCVVGLGNPGTRYTETRHNIGFRVVERLATEHDTDIQRLQFQALTATISVGRTEVLLMKPQTYMNLSGHSVADACGSLGVANEGIVVAYDDVDLPLGRIRVRPGGSAAGHRGIASIIDALSSESFARVRLGVGRPAEGVDTAQYVLQDFAAAEHQLVEATVARAAAAIETLIEDGIEASMCAFNGA